MDRRAFLRKSIVISAAAGLSGALNENLFGASNGNVSFSIEIFTDIPDKAISLIDSYIKLELKPSGMVKLVQNDINGVLNGDVVLFENDNLVNYKSSDYALNDIAKELGLPKVIENPVRLKFQNFTTPSFAKKFLVLHEEKIVAIINSSERQVLNIPVKNGNVIVSINDNKASVISSPCAHKNCVKTGAISRVSESIICIPNRLQVRAE